LDLCCNGGRLRNRRGTGEAIEGANVKFVPAEGTGGCGCGGGAEISVSTMPAVTMKLPIRKQGFIAPDGVANKPGNDPSVRFEDLEISADTTANFELEPGGCLIAEDVLKKKIANHSR
jgi:hypothetical protein